MHTAAQLRGKDHQIVHRSIQRIIAVTGLATGRIAAQSRCDSRITSIRQGIDLHRPVFVGIGKTMQQNHRLTIAGHQGRKTQVTIDQLNLFHRVTSK